VRDGRTSVVSVRVGHDLRTSRTRPPRAVGDRARHVPAPQRGAGVRRPLTVGSTRWWCGRRASGGRHRDPSDREAWLADVTSLVDPRTCVGSSCPTTTGPHGSLRQLLEMCPRATLVTTWAAPSGCPARSGRRPTGCGGCTTGRARHRRPYAPGDPPPAYDSPTTRALFDPTSGVLWSSDAFATRCRRIGRLGGRPPAAVLGRRDGAVPPPRLCPWIAIVDRGAYGARSGASVTCDRRSSWVPTPRRSTATRSTMRSTSWRRCPHRPAASPRQRRSTPRSPPGPEARPDRRRRREVHARPRRVEPASSTPRRPHPVTMP